ncbi:MAG: methyltransferase [Thermodesulfobacteriota bacterium]
MNGLAPKDKLREIDKRFGIETAPVTIRGKTLLIAQVRDINRLVEKQFSQDDPLAEFPFWARIWEASIILADQLAQLEPDDGKEMLEIGAGIGLSGLFAAAFGHKVTITDYDQDALCFAMFSAEINGLDKVRFQTLDWCAPTIYKKYHYIIGSEVLFNENLLLPLYKFIKRALASYGIVYLAHDKSRMSPCKFFELAQKDFKIECRARVMRADDEEFHIVLHRLTRK